MSRREDREEAFFLVFEDAFLKHHDPNKIFKTKADVSPFARQVFVGIKENKEIIEKLIEENVVNWRKDRLSKVIISALRIAIYEMLFEPSIEVSISINEAVEICKKYGAAKDASLVNAILAKVASKKEAK